LFLGDEPRGVRAGKFLPLKHVLNWLAFQRLGITLLWDKTVESATAREAADAALKTNVDSMEKFSNVLFTGSAPNSKIKMFTDKNWQIWTRTAVYPDKTSAEMSIRHAQPPTDLEKEIRLQRNCLYYRAAETRRVDLHHADTDDVGDDEIDKEGAEALRSIHDEARSKGYDLRENPRILELSKILGTDMKRLETDQDDAWKKDGAKIDGNNLDCIWFDSTGEARAS